MAAKQKRNENRSSHKLRFNPLSCYIVDNDDLTELKIINYHYRGACFKIDPNKIEILKSDAKLIFKIGKNEIKTKLNFEITWNTIKKNGLFGVKFTTESSFILKRAHRIKAHSVNIPSLSVIDPLDPNRMIYFKVENISKSGMLLQTSLTNRHMLPGMILKNANLEISGMGSCLVDLFVENSRKSNEPGSIFFGVSINNIKNNDKFMDLISKYILSLGDLFNESEVNGISDRISLIKEEGYFNKHLHKNLTIKEVSGEKAYEETLKLRYLCYKKSNKVRKNFTWQDMGHGLESEGVIIAAYLGGQQVASCEFLLKSDLKLNIERKLKFESLNFTRNKNYAEINKLSVHPSIQKTDVVLGIFQKVHALATLNGCPDGIILAEDRLKPLYSRLGFKDTGLKLPHEYMEGIELSVMVIKSEAYSNSDGMNPYAWSIAFEESQKYFNSVGLSKSSGLSIKQKFLKYLSRKISYFSGKNKSNKKNKKLKDNIIEKCYASPKYTRQQLNATILLSYLLEIKDYAGEKWLDDLLNDYEFNLDYFKSTSNWVSVLFFDELIERFSKVGDPYLLNEKAAYRATKKEILGVNYFIIKHFLNPSIAFKALEIYLPKFNKTRTYKLIESSWSSAKIRILNNSNDLIPKDKSAKIHWESLLNAYVLLATGRPAKVETISSTFDGDEYCEYLVRWENSFFKSESFVIRLPLFVLSVLPMLLIKHFVGLSNSIFIGLTALTFLFLMSFFYYKKYKKMHSEMLTSYNNFEDEVDMKYQELHSAKSVIESDYQTSKIIDEINLKIQNSNSIKDILNSCLEMTCENLDFSRAFVMLVDENIQFLQTFSVYSKNDTSELLWKYKVDISKKREKNVFLSSVYNTSQSIIIKDVEDHIGLLNEESRMLVKSLKTNGFIMMPIPGEDGNWGVLIADKVDKKNKLNRRDLVSLQRVSQSVGLSLDKNKKIEEEKLIRNSFQKYVPSAIVDEILGQQCIATNSIKKEVICMFMDIRDFTKISGEIPPKLLIETLNSIFQILEDEIKKSGGLIDKYLGDGAFVTWGSIPGSEPCILTAVESSLNFIKKIEKFNKELRLHGQPAMNVGLGLHIGNVLVGNIGSDNKKEFTVIGESVNLASRLEPLNKLYNSNIVVSEKIYSSLKNIKGWCQHKGIKIRGYDSEMDIATYSLRGE